MRSFEDAGAAVVAEDAALEPSVKADAALEPSGKADAAPDVGADSGGNWSKCYEHFRLGPQPKVDVLQIGILCGPSNGMRQVTLSAKPLQHKTGMVYTWLGRPKDCFRLFAVAPPGSSRLTVEMLGPGRRPLAQLSTRRRWLVFKPRAPLCVKRAGRYRARVWAEHATAHPEVQLWRLR